MKFSVIIPTLNSAKTVGLAISSAIKQGAEVIVVDSFSSDGTDKIAEGLGAKVIRSNATMLEARMEGIKLASSEYIINLDSDMYLVDGILIRIPYADAIALGEITIGKGIVAKLINVDREITHMKFNENLKAGGGVIPRVYKKDVILNAYEKVPERLKKLSAFEDSFIYYLSQVKEPKFIPNAVYHIEDDSVIEFIKKWYNYGRNAKLIKGTDYEFLINRKGRPGTTYAEKIKLLPITLVKGVPFALGYYF